MNVTIYKLDHDGNETFVYRGEVLERSGTAMIVEARFGLEHKRQDYVTFKKGDRFVEYYYSDRWYNIYAIYDVDDDSLKGWYCNITRPAEFADGEIRFRDLALDYFVQPSGREFILDGDEFAALPLLAADRAAARAALVELRTLAAARAGPFADLNATSRKP